MKVTITYCNPCNFLSQASRVDNELKEAFDDIEVELVEGENCTFGIRLGYTLLFAREECS